MAFTIRIEGADAAALERQAAAEGRSVEDVAHEAIRTHVERTAPDLESSLASARADDEFNRHLDEVVERDRAILDRLAE